MNLKYRGLYRNQIIHNWHLSSLVISNLLEVGSFFRLRKQSIIQSIYTLNISSSTKAYSETSLAVPTRSLRAVHSFNKSKEEEEEEKEEEEEEEEEEEPFN